MLGMGLGIWLAKCHVTCLVFLQPILMIRNATTLKNPKPVRTLMSAISTTEILKEDKWLLRGGPDEPMEVDGKF